MPQIDLFGVLFWGLFATGLLTLIMSGSQGLGWTRIGLPFLVGSIFTARRRRAVVLGIICHIITGWAFAFLYALAFESWDHSTWYLGALLGVYHAAFLAVVGMSVLPSIHPRMAGRHSGPTPTKQLEPPGFLGLNYGYRTPVVILVAHVVYGITLGAFYQPV